MCGLHIKSHKNQAENELDSVPADTDSDTWSTDQTLSQYELEGGGDVSTPRDAAAASTVVVADAIVHQTSDLDGEMPFPPPMPTADKHGRSIPGRVD